MVPGPSFTLPPRPRALKDLSTATALSHFALKPGILISKLVACLYHAPEGIIRPVQNRVLKTPHEELAFSRVSSRHMSYLLWQPHRQANVDAEAGMPQGRHSGGTRIGLPAPHVFRIKFLDLANVVTHAACDQQVPAVGEVGKKTGHLFRIL
jgi:hypothetical protein